jgi:hypothetical protein
MFTNSIKNYRARLAAHCAARGDLPERDVLRQSAGLPAAPRSVAADAIAELHSRPRRLAAAAGAGLAPHIEDVVDEYLKDESNGD